MVAYNLREISNQQLKYEYELSVTQEDLHQEIQQKANEYSQKIQIPGFRRGKVSPSVVMQKHKSDLRREAIEDVVNMAREELINKFHIVGNIDVQPVEGVDNGDFIATCFFEIFPNFPDIELSSINIENIICEPSEEDLHNEIEKIKAEKKNFITVDKKAEIGDSVDIDFKIYVDERPIKGGDAKNYRIILGQGQMIEDFEKAIIGMNAGENKDFDFMFPDNYHADHLAGKKAHAEIFVINVLQNKKINNINDLAESLGFTNQSELENNVRLLLQKNTNQMIREIKVRDLFDQVEQITGDDAPEHLLQEELELLKKESSFSSLEQDKLERIARRRICAGLFLLGVGRKYNIKVDQQEITKYIMSQISHYGEKGRELLDFYIKNENARQDIFRKILEEKSIDLVLSHVTYTERKMSMSELQSIHSAIGHDLFDIGSEDQEEISFDKKESEMPLNNKEKSLKSETKKKIKNEESSDQEKVTTKKTTNTKKKSNKEEE